MRPRHGGVRFKELMPSTGLREHNEEASCRFSSGSSRASARVDYFCRWSPTKPLSCAPPGVEGPREPEASTEPSTFVQCAHLRCWPKTLLHEKKSFRIKMDLSPVGHGWPRCLASVTKLLGCSRFRDKLGLGWPQPNAKLIRLFHQD